MALCSAEFSVLKMEAEFSTPVNIYQAARRQNAESSCTYFASTGDDVQFVPPSGLCAAVKGNLWCGENFRAW